MTFAYTPNEGGDPVLHVKSLDSDKEYVIAVGAAAGGGGGRAGGGRGAAAGGAANGGSVFSEDSHWAAYMVNPAWARRRRSLARRPRRTGSWRARRGAGRANAGCAGTPRAAQPRDRREELDSKRRIVEVLGDLEVGSPCASIVRSPPRAPMARRLRRAPASNGADLILRDLTTGADHAIGNVDQYDFDDAGKLLAYTVDAVEKLGNGVYVLDPATGTTRALNTGAATYDASRVERRRYEPGRAPRRQVART